MIFPSPEDNKILWSLMQGLKTAMLTTVGADGAPYRRPMATLPGEFDGTVWFFTDAASHEVDEVQREQHVSIDYDDLEVCRYASLFGRATLVREHRKLEERWLPMLLTWFPLGLQDPQLALLRVEADSWEYRDGQATSGVLQDCAEPSRQLSEPIAQEKLRTGDTSDTWVIRDVEKLSAPKVLPDAQFPFASPQTYS